MSATRTERSILLCEKTERTPSFLKCPTANSVACESAKADNAQECRTRPSRRSGRLCGDECGCQPRDSARWRNGGEPSRQDDWQGTRFLDTPLSVLGVRSDRALVLSRPNASKNQQYDPVVQAVAWDRPRHLPGSI